jgi:hypothetical protein
MTFDSPSFAGQRQLLFRRRLAAAGERDAGYGEKREREYAQGDRRWSQREPAETEAPFYLTSLWVLRRFRDTPREFNHG